MPMGLGIGLGIGIGGGSPFPGTPPPTGLIQILRGDVAVYKDIANAPAADGDGIFSWADQSGSGNNVTQLTSGNRPTYKTNIINGKAIARFDATNDNIGASSSVINLAHALTYHCVAKARVAHDGVLFATLNSGTAVGDMFRFRSNGGALEYRWLSTGASIYDQAATVSPGSFVTLSVVVRSTSGANGTVTIYENGVALGTSGSLARAGSHDGNLTIGATTDDGTRLDGDMGVSLLYDGLQSAADFLSAVAFCRGWGLHY